MTLPVKIGLLGSGFLQDFHMQAYKEIPGVEIVAVGAYTEEEASTFAGKWKIPAYYFGEDAIGQVCSDPSVEVVSIGIPNKYHAIAAKLAAENGKHVICEKPLGRTGDEARQMLKDVEKAGVVHCYAENQVFFPLHAHAFETAKNGTLGDVYWVRSREAHSGPHSRWFYEEAGGGVAIDMGCHSIEVARKFFGNDTPVEAFMWGRTLYHDTKHDDNSIILVKFKNGQLGQAENSWTAHGGLDLRTEVYGREGALFLDNTRETGMRIFTNVGMGYSVEKSESDTGWMYPVPQEYRVYGYFDELKHFIECIRNGDEPIETFKDGVVVNAILDAAYESLKTGRWTKVE